MYSATPGCGGSVRQVSGEGLDTTTKTVGLETPFAAEFGNRNAQDGARSQPERLPHHPSAPGYGHP
jgi:hypothetical protein